MNLNRYIVISLILGLILLGNQPIPQTVEADLELNASRQSDINTTPNNSTFFLTVTGSTQFRNMSDNSFLAAIDLLTFGEDVTSIYDIRFRFIFRNEALNWSMAYTSPKTGTLTEGQMFFEEIFTVGINETFPEYLNVSIAYRYTENMESGDVDSGGFFANMFDIHILNGVPPSTAELRPPNIEETTTIITETEDVFAPYVSDTPKSWTYDIDTPYNVSWTIFGDLPRNYRINVSDGMGTHAVLSQGSWTSGETLIAFSINQTQQVGLYHYTLEADNDYNQLYFSNVSIAVLNFTYYNDKYDGLAEDLAGDLPQLADVPFPFLGVVVTLMSIILYRRKKVVL